MRLLTHASIKRRLTALIMAASSISVLLTTLTISTIGVYNLKLNIMDELAVSAAIVGDRNTAALLFNDDKLAESNMRVFAVKRSVRQACLYDNDYIDATGARSVKTYPYVSEELESAPPVCPANQTPRKDMTGRTLEVMQSVGKETAGSIYIESDLREVDAYIQKQTYIAIAVTLAVMFVSYLLALGLQRTISAPILSLAATAREISVNKDYTVRARPFGSRGAGASNELRQLTDSFNSMLQEIGERDSRLRQQNIELERARDAAEAANRAKSQFLANISHELRTPLNAIIGFSSILMNQLFGPVGDNKYLEYSKDINESGTHLLDLINDILDLAKAEAGKLELNYEEMHIGKAVAKCIAILADRAAKGKVTVSTNIPKDLPPLLADRLRFIQIMLNVLSNAIKFTEEGGKVHIAAATREVEEVITHFVITVTDSGIGMKPEDIAKAFQSFGQLDSGLNRKYEGTGLGLPLTRMLLGLHHGTMELESEPGIGTKVTLIFPALPPLGQVEGALS